MGLVSWSLTSLFSTNMAISETSVTWGPEADTAMGNGQFSGKRGGPLYATGKSAKTAVPIEMTFALWTQVGPRNHALDVGPDPAWEEAFWGRRGGPL